MNITGDNIVNKYVIGIDFGTDSVRSVIIDTSNGDEIGSSIKFYPRWKDQKYCNAPTNQFRQHPLDYLESIEGSIKEAIKNSPDGTADSIRAISIDTTGSTSTPINKDGVPLALTPEFQNNPNAMFVLWKDHTSIKEANDINEKCRANKIDYTCYSGGTYSSEWFWSNMLHVFRNDKEVADETYSWVEHCDWMPAVLTGNTNPLEIKRSRCAAGHKAMWHEDFGGYPPAAFLSTIDPILGRIRETLPEKTYTADIPVGTLSKEWSDKLGLSQDVIIGGGALDAHFGAVGAEIKENTLVRIMGTSTCDMVISKASEMPENPVRGISSQVDGSITPGYIGMEAGQSAFGDLFAWFMRIMVWPIKELYPSANIEDITGDLFKRLEKNASEIDNDFNEYAIDWFNGRRTPDSNQALKGAIMGLNLGTDAPRMYKAMIESAAYGTKAIVDRFTSEGIKIESVIAIGGVAQKSPLIMQTVSDVLGMPITISSSGQTCALGAAMFASVIAGVHKDLLTAQQVMGSGFNKTYTPNLEKKEVLTQRYKRYLSSGAHIEETYKY